MKLSKITVPVIVVFISIISLPVNAVTGTSDMLKKQVLLRLKPFLLLQSQPGKILQKSASITKKRAPDSTETYSWENESWKKSSIFRFSYDSLDRITGMSLGMDDGFEEQILYDYNPDGITIGEMTVFNWGLGGELFDPETMYAVIKYYPGYANSINLINSDITIYDVGAVFKTFSNLDSIISFGYERGEDGEFDTLHRSLSRYSKTGNRRIRVNLQTVSESDPGKLIRYSTDYIATGNGQLDTLKCVLQIGADMDSANAAILKEVQYLMYTTRKNQQDQIIEQTAMTGTDSNFSSFTDLSKVIVHYNLSGEIDSCVTLAYDKNLESWKNSEKVIYLYPTVIAGVKRDKNSFQIAQLVTIERKHSSLYLNIPTGMTVYEIEQLDIQGKMLSRTAVNRANNNIAIQSLSMNSSAVTLVRLETDRGDFICKISSVK